MTMGQTINETTTNEMMIDETIWVTTTIDEMGPWQPDQTNWVMAITSDMSRPRRPPTRFLAVTD
jgi:hypothetical protein